jgi:hypothetical protein
MKRMAANPQQPQPSYPMATPLLLEHKVIGALANRLLLIKCPANQIFLSMRELENISGVTAMPHNLDGVPGYILQVGIVPRAAPPEEKAPI